MRRQMFGAGLLLAALSGAPGTQAVAQMVAQTVAPVPSAPPVPAQPSVPAEIQPGGPARAPDVQGPAASPLAQDAPSMGQIAPTLPAPASPGSTGGAVPR